MTIRILRLIRWTTFAAMATLVLGIGLVEFVPAARQLALGPFARSAPASADATIAVPSGVPIGGPFKLTDDKGGAVGNADYRGHWMLVFFGYSNCPDECPLAVLKMAATPKERGPLADKVAPLFITVDRTRDMPVRLASYLENLDTRIIGLTGSDEQVAAVAKTHRVYYAPAQNEQSGADLITHSTFLYLMNPDRKLAALFSQDTTADRLAAALRARVAPR
jgi:cytochrome oxidase Cu insertion factor (SCO1/SenC/PrrC family)